MKKSYFQKLLTILLACLMLAGSFTAAFVVSADTDGSGTGGEGDGTTEEEKISFRSMDEIRKLLYTPAYSDYLANYSNVPVATDEIVINAVNYDKDATTAEVKAVKNFEGVSDALYTPATGETVWKFTVPTTGMYAITLDYYAVGEFEGKNVSTYTTIERLMYIDDALPFSEARYLYFPRQWHYKDSAFLKDADGNFTYEYDSDGKVVRKRLKYDYAGNDILPDREEAPEWRDYFLRDWNGFTMKPFQIYLEAGEHTLSFEGTREAMMIGKITLYGYHDEISYSEFYDQKVNKEGVKVIETLGEDQIRVQFEDPDLISDAQIIPTTNRTSAVTLPVSPAYWKFNVIAYGGANQWAEYKVTVPEDGMYRIVTRFRQNLLIGMFTSRRLVINGELQFKEAQELRFNYSPDWQSVALSDGSEEYKDGFLFYLKKGENTLRFDVVVGDMESYVSEMKSYVTTLNNSYRSILRLTGTNPDANRDYGFMRLIPEAINNIGNVSVKMMDMYNRLVKETGQEGDQTKAIQTYAELFEKMANDPDEIAPNFLLFKSYISSMTSWMYTMLGQSITQDYFVIQGTKDPLPQAMATSLDFVLFELRAFIASFSMDYTTIDFVIEEGQEYSYDDDDVVEVWISGGRDTALISRRLADENFTPETGYKLRYKVITLAIMNAVLAGIGPDVGEFSGNDSITWGLRDGLIPLNKDSKYWTWKDGHDAEFDATLAQFSDALVTQSTLYGVTYGLPTSMEFYMTFYRSDVFYELGVDAPETWEDLYGLLPTLQANNMEVGLPIGLEGTQIFMYQRGIELYKEDGMQINLDSNGALDAFTDLCNMYTKYTCPIAYDLTRFRTGEIPLVIAQGITTYNSLMSYIDIRGLWEMTPLLGRKQEDGSINHTSIATCGTFQCLPRGCKNPEASWQYISWLRGEKAETLQNRENRLLGTPVTKFGMPNKNVFLAQPWTESEKAAIVDQVDSLAGIPYYPGNYIIATYVDSAFQVVYSNRTNPADELLNRVVYINREISRKRADFLMETYEDVLEKRQSEANQSE